MVVDDDEDEEEGRGDGGLANVTRPGVGHGILTQLGESERSRNSVTLSASSSATRSQWQYATTAEGHRGGVFERQCHVEVVITSPTKTPSRTLMPKRPRAGKTIARL